MNKPKTIATTEGRTLTMSRVFKAPPELMFEIWGDCKHLKHWWGPREWPMEECEIDFRVDGTWRYCLRGPNSGDESWGLAVFSEIKRPDKIAYRDHFTDRDGNINTEMPTLRSTVEFIGENGHTRLLITVRFESQETLQKILEMGMVEGMDSSLDRMDEYLLKVASTG